MEDMAGGLCGTPGSFVDIDLMGCIHPRRYLPDRRKEPTGPSTDVEHSEILSRELPYESLKKTGVQKAFYSLCERGALSI